MRVGQRPRGGSLTLEPSEAPDQVEYTGQGFSEADAHPRVPHGKQDEQGAAQGLVEARCESGASADIGLVLPVGLTRAR